MRGQHLLDNGVVRDLLDLLGEEADAQVLARADLAPVKRHLAHDKTEERGLAGPVRADKADPHARLDMQARLVEHRLSAEGFGDVGEVKHQTGRIPAGRGGFAGGAAGWSTGIGRYPGGTRAGAASAASPTDRPRIGSSPRARPVPRRRLRPEAARWLLSLRPRSRESPRSRRGRCGPGTRPGPSPENERPRSRETPSGWARA